MNTLNEKITLPCGVELKNRILKSAMSESMAKKFRPKIEFQRLYRRWASGGTGVVVTGNVMIDSRHLGELGNVVIERGLDNYEGLRNWAKCGTINNTQLWVQLNHPGKQTPKFLTPEPVAPSAIGYTSYLKNGFNTPRALSEEEIFDIIDRFAYAGKVVKDCGFSGIQIHGAHGYLVSQFLSPLHNQRNDQWGGSIENRMRFVREIYKAIRSEVGEQFPVSIKLNSADFQKGGFSEEDSMEVVKTLAKDGIDLIEISGGTYEAPKMMSSTPQRETTKKREAFFLEYATKVRKLVDIPLCVTGGFRTLSGMLDAIDSNSCDMVGLGRSLVLDPDFSNKLLHGENVQSKVRPLSSGVGLVDKMIPLEITWYAQQIHRMGKGKAPKPSLSVWRSIFKTLGKFGLDGIKKVR